MTPRLFVYGTLAPGRPNEHVLADVPGTWEPAAVRGALLQEGWGFQHGFPGLVLDENAPEVRGVVFRSAELDAQWDRLDDFEGAGYERVHTDVRLDAGGTVEAQIYVLRDHTGAADGDKTADGDTA